MKQKVLLTGRPGCGKTTLIKRVVENLQQRSGGFSPRRFASTARVGFKVVTLDGMKPFWLMSISKHRSASENTGRWRDCVRQIDLAPLEAPLA